MNKQAAALLPAVALMLLASLAVAQQVKKARNATITAQSMELNWESGEVEFIGNVKLVIAGDINADMIAPRMSVKLSPKGDKVLSVLAHGPVQFTIVTAPDANGQRRKIVASATEQATYAADTDLVKLTGGATADMLPLEGTAGIEAIHFTGQTITANLKTNRLTVDQANLTVQTQ